MATIAVATASDASDAGSGSLHPGRMQITAGMPAGNGPTESGLIMAREADKSEWVLSGLLPPRVTDKNRHAKESLPNSATVPGAIIGFDF